MTRVCNLKSLLIFICFLAFASTVHSEDDVLIGEKMLRFGELVRARYSFEKMLKANNRDPRAHYFLGIIEYEEGNIDKAKTRFQIAHECLSSFDEDKNLSLDEEQIQLEFPDDYEARIYYKDGWYIYPKDPAVVDSPVRSLESGSNYRIKLRPSSRKSFTAKTVIVSLVALSFFLAR